MAEFHPTKNRESSTPQQCSFCTANVKSVDYKDIDVLKKVTNPQGKIGKRRRTNACATHQRMLARAIKRARFLALLPYTSR
jgi:small subunit ribosomal protein S18